MTVLAAFGRADVATYVSAVLWVYTLLLIAYVVTSLIFSIGVRIPYSRWTDGLLGFLRDVCEPYLSLFRRFIPPLGPIDVTPLVAIFVLQIVGQLIVSLIHG